MSQETPLYVPGLCSCTVGQMGMSSCSSLIAVQEDPHGRGLHRGNGIESLSVKKKKKKKEDSNINRVKEQFMYIPFCYIKY